MSFEIMFLLGCLSILGAFVVVLTISTIIMGSRYGLRLQYVFNSLKYNKDVDDKIKLLLSKVQANLMIARIDSDSRSIKFYTPDSLSEHIRSKNSWDTRQTHEAEIWIGNKYTQYGYLKKYYTISKSELVGKCPSYSVFRELIALEDKLNGKSDEPEEKPISTTRKKDVVELE